MLTGMYENVQKHHLQFAENKDTFENRTLIVMRHLSEYVRHNILAMLPLASPAVRCILFPVSRLHLGHKDLK